MAPMMAAPRRDKTVPLLLEAIPGFFGVYGIGWLVSGFTSTGLMLLIGGIIFSVVMLIITIFTLGFGLLCWGPINLVVMITSTIILNKRLDSGV
jgi:hypothetical protein